MGESLLITAALPSFFTRRCPSSVQPADCALVIGTMYVAT